MFTYLRGAFYLGALISMLSACDSSSSSAELQPTSLEEESSASIGAPDADLRVAAFSVPAGFSSGLIARPSNTECAASNFTQLSSHVDLEPFSPLLIFNQPVFMRARTDKENAWLLGERSGLIYSFTQNDRSAEVFADLSEVVNSAGTEQGLLGLALHPNFTEQPELFVSYTNHAEQPVVVRYLVDLASERILPDSAQTVLLLDAAVQRYNGGDLAFGPDGYLYIAIGDGGAVSSSAAQDTSSLLGSMLRIDVSEMPYQIPPDNPFAVSSACDGDSDSACPEIWAWGLRNPWRWSFDSETGKLWAGDVGENSREEINLIQKGKNYGWHCFEGELENQLEQCNEIETEAPVAAYGRDDGLAITGGYVYRGDSISDLQGFYIYGDFSSGRIWALDSVNLNAVPQKLLDSGLQISSFAQSTDGEVYVLDYAGGGLYQLAAREFTGSANLKTNLSETGCVQPENPAEVMDGVIPYAVNSQFWADSAEKSRWFSLPDDSHIFIDDDEAWEFPKGSVIVKRFQLNNRPVETRFLIRNNNGQWQGYSYAWNEAGTDAELLQSAETRNFDGQDWYYPAGQCFTCHTQSAGIVLGPENSQINKDMLYPSTGAQANQLGTLNHIGMLVARETRDLSTVLSIPDPMDTSAALAERARAYLHTNCSICHRPDSSGRGGMDFRYQTPLNEMQSCNVNAFTGSTGAELGVRLIPGDGENSVIYKRMVSEDPHERMPTIAVNIVDQTGTTLIRDWIDSLSGCE